ncbi:unnamed protein product [Caenorhabditis angaria]|uniref:DUF19 domain-containing protein n=1 Tax=Caenorhabditis angaria TaxID=860376 RepID=A0A9P1MV09_9PELO|nr:unnamed protein product [Caenorhabditis angaria]
MQKFLIFLFFNIQAVQTLAPNLLCTAYFECLDTKTALLQKQCLPEAEIQKSPKKCRETLKADFAEIEKIREFVGN